MKKNLILKEAGFLLIIAFLILSTFSANSLNTQSVESNVIKKPYVSIDNREILWDNGLDYEGLGASQLDDNFDPIFADDFVLEAPYTTIYNIHWIGGYWSGPPDDGNFDWEVTIYEDCGDGNRVGAILWQQLFTNTDTSETFIQGNPGGVNYYSYDVYLIDPLTLTAGEKYWLSIQGIGVYPPQSGWAYHSSVLLHQALFKSVYFGYPDWIDIEVFWEDPYDFCFQINGYDIVPDLDCDGTLSWIGVKAGTTVIDSFTVENIGDAMSMVDWKIKSYPDWGKWAFNPESGTGLTPEDGPIIIDVIVVSPEEKNTEFKGEIVLVNVNDPTDTCTIDVSLATPYIKNLPLLEKILDKFPNISPMIRKILGI